MEKEFVPYDEALTLKELGFDEPCMAQFNGSNGFDGFGGNYKNSYFNYPDQVALPLYQQAFRFFREKYGYYYEIFVDDDKTFGFLISYFVEIGRGDKPIQRKYETYEEAELECLKKLIEIVKQKK